MDREKGEGGVIEKLIEKEAKKWRGKEKKEANNGNSFFPICIWESRAIKMKKKNTALKLLQFDM